MKKLNLKEAKTFLSGCDEDTPEEPVIVMRGRKPVAVLLPVGDADLENVAVSFSPAFRAIMEESRTSLEKHGGISHEDICREFGLPVPGTEKNKDKPTAKKGKKKTAQPRRSRGEANGS